MALELFGQPNGPMSSANTLRFGSNGSLSVEIAGARAGQWISFEDGGSGGVLDLIVRARGGTRAEAMAWLKSRPYCPQGSPAAAEARTGPLLPGGHRPWPVPPPGPAPAPPGGSSISSLEDANPSRQEEALALWRAAQPIAGTPGELYLIARGLDPRKLVSDPALAGQWPETLRFTWDWPGMALLVAVNDARTGLVVAVQRIFVRPNGRPVHKAEVFRDVAPEKNKKIKLSLGPIDGNAARFSGWPDPDGRWGLAEGPETALAAQQIHGFPVWASIFAGNMAKVAPPHWARHAVIFVDHDRAGQLAGTATHARLLHEPRPPLLTVEIIQADTLGADAADMLRKGA